MKKIIVVGGGFAGISALKVLSRSPSDLKLVLIDRKETSDFLPSLPDALGQKIAPEFIKINLGQFAQQIGCKLINEEVKSINLENRSLTLNSESIAYDYLILCSGTQTNFFGNREIEKQAFKLDNVTDAEKILKALKSESFDELVVVGGGYTGIEIATNLRRYCLNHKKEKRIIIIEKSSTLLGPLPQWIKDYVRQNLAKLNIDIFTSDEVTEVQGKQLTLGSGLKFKKALLIWAAGVKSSEYIFKLIQNKTQQGRLKVDPYLKIDKNCFVAGDIANFSFNGQSLRMGVQFAVKQGNLAAKNILNVISGNPLLKYKPRDLGYIIPMANNQSCGVALGLRVKGLPATFFHYSMCVFRSWRFRNKWGIVKNLILSAGDT